MIANNKFKFEFQIFAPREDYYQYYFCIIISSESSERNVKR